MAKIVPMSEFMDLEARGHEPSQGWGLLEERGPNGELFARHVHGPNVDDLVLSELSGAVYYYHQDHLNSTVAVTDASGSVVEQYRYDVYGQPSFFGPDCTPRAESALGIRFLFTGREWLGSVGLYDYRHRAYSPALGRFLQMDPLGFAAGDVNVYRYCRDSALCFVDPFGLRVVFVEPNILVGEKSGPYLELQRVMENAWRTEFTKQCGDDYPFSKGLKELVRALEEAEDIDVHIRAGPAYNELGGTSRGITDARKFPRGPMLVEVNPITLALNDWRETLVHELVHVLIFAREKCPSSSILKNQTVKEVLDDLERYRAGRRSLHFVWDYTWFKDVQRSLDKIIIDALLSP